MTIDAAVTPGDIARTLREPPHRVENILNTRGHIRALRRVGIVRVYGIEAVELVRQELAAIDAKRTKQSV